MQYDEYDAFLSYRHTDKALVTRVQRILELLVPRIGGEKNEAAGEGKEGAGERRRGWQRRRDSLHIFRDDTDLPAGELTPLIQSALSRSRFLIVFCSREAAESDYVWKEIRFFFGLFPIHTKEGMDAALSRVLFAGCEERDEDNREIVETLIRKALDGEMKRSGLREIRKRAAEILRADFGSAKGLFAGRKIRNEAYRLGAAVQEVSYDRLRPRAELRRRTGILKTGAALFAIVFLFQALLSAYHSLRNRDARTLSLAAGTLLEEGDPLLAAQLALSTTRSRWGYRTLAPEAVRVLADASRDFEPPSALRIGAGESFRFSSGLHHPMDVSPDGHYAAAVNEKGDLSLWDMEKGEEAWTGRLPLSDFAARIRFLEGDRFLVQSPDACRLYGTEDPDPLWEVTFEAGSGKFRAGYPDGSALEYFLEGAGSESLVNTASAGGKEDALLFLETGRGLTLRETETGRIMARLSREDMEALVPEGTSPYKNPEFWPLKNLTDLYDAREIGYDRGRDCFLIPCYQTGYSDPDCSGLLRWAPRKGEASYVSLRDPEECWPETLFYPDGRVLILSCRTEGILLEAYDSLSGEKLWEHKEPACEATSYPEESLVLTREGLILAARDRLILLDPEDGRALAGIPWERASSEPLEMILEREEDDLTLLTGAGRLCCLRDRTLLEGEAGSDAGDLSVCRYIPAAGSRTGRGQLFGWKETGIFRYETGFENDAYREVLSRPAGSSFRDPMLEGVTFSAEGGCLLAAEKDSFAFFDPERGEEPLWESGPARFEQEWEKTGGRAPVTEEEGTVTCIGTDPLNGRPVFCRKDLAWFAEADLRTGDLVFWETERRGPEDGKTDRLLGASVTGRGILYVEEWKRGDELDYILYQRNWEDGSFESFPLSGPFIRTERREIRTEADPSGRCVLVIGPPEGVWLVDTGEGTAKLLDFEAGPDGRIDIGKNYFFLSNWFDRICAFDPAGRYFALNYPAVRRLAVFDFQGKEVSSMEYYNTTLTEMVFSDGGLLTVSLDGRIERRRIRDLKLLEAVNLPGEDTRFTLAGRDREGFWLRSRQYGACYVEEKGLGCRQVIRNVLSIDTERALALVGFYEGNTFRAGTLPLLTREEILERAGDLVGERQMSEEDKRYYGVR